MELGNIRYHFETGITPVLAPCPGVYCARTLLSDGNWSACGGCSRGFRKNATNFACVSCDDDLARYDWLYLGFMALLPILLHLISIPGNILKRSKDASALVLCSIVEIALGSIITLLVWDPVGKLTLRSCGVSQLSDWYPIFYNPRPNYEESVHCTHEVVYPLYTIVLVFYAISDVLMIVLRLSLGLAGIKVARSIYSALYFYPLLALLHLVLGGLIYYVFPYITIIASVISCAYHFACRHNQKVASLLLESVRDWRNVGIILCHWFLHAYGIISITEMTSEPANLSLLLLVPLPALLYIVTANFTDPTKIHVD